ncbi:MAG TPA: M20/M25/M40 family metallo-hydrolase [Chloroflexia bacterium]|nr:M20/M25/M40 family metallo-hydrolase [Chloroflexia bacterium]
MADVRSHAGTAPGIEPEVVEALWAQARELQAPMVDFTRRLIQTPSLPGEEGDVARLVAEEMATLGYDQIRIDEVGSVIGIIRPTGEHASAPMRRIMLNTHIDQVDVGDESRWPYPPFEGRIVDGEIWGRGSSDLKGSLATHVYAGALLKRTGIPLPNEVYVTGVVQEEVGGLGSFVLAESLPVDYVLIGEPSANRIALGHRGRLELVVTITGKSVHASVPDTGINPLYSMSRFLLALEQVTFEPDPNHPALGPTTIAPTLFTTDQKSANVLPGECKVVLDVRNTPADTAEVVLSRVQAVLDEALTDGATATLTIPPLTLTSYTGVTRTIEVHHPWGLGAETPLATGTLAVLRAALKREVPVQMWRFATDAGHFAGLGIPVIGFGPGYEEVIHTVNERISIELMVEGMVAAAALAVGLK